MGNLLCVPKSSKGRGTPKKRSLNKWLFQRNKVDVHVDKEGNNSDTQQSSDNTGHKVISQSDAYHKGTSKKDGMTGAYQPEYHIDPVVSSSILLKPFDEELECNTERSKTSEDPDVSEIGESISGTEQQQQQDNNTDDEQQLEEPDEVSSIGKANVSGIKDPAFENTPRTNKEVNQQSEISDDVTVVSIRSISATEEPHCEEKPQNSTGGEQQTEKYDRVCSNREANISAAVESQFEEKPEDKTDGEQQSEESDDVCSVEVGHSLPTDSLSVQETSGNSADWDPRSVNSDDAPSFSKESISATKDLCIEGNMSQDITTYEECDTEVNQYRHISLPDTDRTSKDKADEIDTEKLVNKDAMAKCDEVVSKPPEEKADGADEEDKIHVLTNQIGTDDMASFTEVQVKTEAVEVVGDLSATPVKKMSRRIIEVKPVQGYSKPDDDTYSPKGDDFHDKGYEKRSRVFDVDKRKPETKTANNDKRETNQTIFTKDITPATYEPVCTTFAPVCINKRIPGAESTELQPDTKASRSTNQYSLDALNGEKNPKDNLEKTQADAIPNTFKRDNNRKDKLSLMVAHSCPAIPKKPKHTAQLKELTKMLEALSANKVPPRSDIQQSTSLSRNLPSPQPTTSGLPSGPGHYKSEEGIQKWLKKSTSCSIESVNNKENQAVDQQKRTVSDFEVAKRKVSDFEVPKRKVSDFEVPKKAPRKPPTPLVLKKPSPHLYNLPSIAKTDLEENGTVKWTQREPTGFPGLKVPQALRNKYSFDVQQEDSYINKVDINETDNGGSGHDYTNNDDINTRNCDGNDHDNDKSKMN